MGLQCSLLGHSFEPAGVEREREEQGSEVVTTEREIERCSRCGTERVVSESTEVTAVVDGEAVGLEPNADADAEDGPDSDADTVGDGLAGVVDRSDIDGDDETDADAAGRAPSRGADDRESASRFSDEEYDDRPFGDEPPDPETEDAEILTDDDPSPERAPGQWPDEASSDDESDDEAETGDAVDEADAAEDGTAPEIPGEESLSGITVPEGEIVCPECGFRIDARSGYRGGDSCPECNAWLEAERNQ